MKNVYMVRVNFLRMNTLLGKKLELVPSRIQHTDSGLKEVLKEGRIVDQLLFRV